MRLSLHLVWLALALSCADVSTTTSSSSPGSSSGRPPPPTTGETPECVPDSPWQHVFLKAGGCADVSGADGKWIARALFPDAPEEIRTRACTYRWSTTSAPDVEALRALAEHMTPNCEPEGSQIAPLGAAVAVDPSDTGGVGAPTGVSGCDVCGRLLGRSAYLILPADEPELRRLVVEVEGGTLRIFELTPPTPKAQAFVVELPAAAYVVGQVRLFAATPM
jgi:hypothetical protein